METKRTVRVPRHLLTNAKYCAQVRQTTLTELMATDPQQISSEAEVLNHAPGGNPGGKFADNKISPEIKTAEDDSAMRPDNGSLGVAVTPSLYGDHAKRS
ncbi:MAG TPA: hypothetical protein PKG95_05485 [Anaerolineaceae bacterium]|jgi:hypothetical protein|nr:hypothetical protein [Anaerolineaceae bacterium]